MTARGNKKNHKFQKAPILSSSFSSDNALYLSLRTGYVFSEVPWEKRASVQAPLPSARHRNGRPAETPRPAIDTLGHIADP